MNKLNLTVEIFADNVDGLANGLEAFVEDLRDQPKADFADGTHTCEQWEGNFELARSCNEGTEHNWRQDGKTADDGTEFYRCKTCGLTITN